MAHFKIDEIAEITACFIQKRLSNDSNLIRPIVNSAVLISF
jgi:hypothetical protein